MLCGMLLDNKIINMNNIINEFLLVGDKFMPEMHLRQPKFVYSACGPFTRHKERIKEFKRTGDTRLLYRNELDKACFKHDAAYAEYKNVENRLISDQKLRNSAYDVASNPKYDGYQRGLASMVYKFFDSKVALLDKKTMSVKGNAKHTAKPSSLESTGNNKILAEELHKPVIKKFNKRKVYPQFRDHLWGVDLVDMQSLSKKSKGIKYLLRATDLFSNYAFLVLLKDKKGISIVNTFNKIIKQSNRKPNKIWVDQGGEFYNHVSKKWLSDNDIIMYSTFNEVKSVVAEKFIRTLKNKLYKHMTNIGKNVYYDVLDDIVNEHNNTKHSTIKMKPKDVNDDTAEMSSLERTTNSSTIARNKRVYIDEHNEKSARYNVGNRATISKFKNIFAKGYTPNWSREIFIVNKINDAVPYAYNLKDLNDEEILVVFMMQNCKRLNYNVFIK